MGVDGDIVSCDTCGSTFGFRVTGGGLVCKTCQTVHPFSPSATVREYFSARQWLPEQRYPKWWEAK